MSTRVLARRDSVRLGSSSSALSFALPDVPWSEKRRLQLDGTDAFTLAFWCGTCPLTFERLDGSNRTLSSDELQSRLNVGVTSIEDDLLASVSLILPEGMYVPLLLSVKPRLVFPSQPGDYFAEEQVEHSGIDAFWGIPESPKTPYYRAHEGQLDSHSAMFEFLVPMVPPSWNDRSRVDAYTAEFDRGVSPTVLALSIVDRTQPLDSDDAHTGLIHFVLDGHHKIEAAARSGARLTVLSFVAVDKSLSRLEDTMALLDYLAGL